MSQFLSSLSTFRVSRCFLGSGNQSLAPSDSVWESGVKVGSLGVDSGFKESILGL